MTNKQPDRQNSRRYRYHATDTGARPIARRRSVNQRATDENVQEHNVRRERAASPDSPGRRVTMPHEAVQPLSWSERRERFRQPPASPSTHGRLVQRTLAQTGRPAPVGQMRVSRPLPRQRAGSSVPARSRQTRRGWRFWRKVLGFFAILAVVGGGISFALISPAFHVQQISIQGTQNAGLIAAVRHMGIQGQDIFLLNSSLVVARLDALPLVASADLGVQLPASVTVTIQERVPVLLWQAGRDIFGIGQDGVVIARQSELSATDHLGLVVDKRPASKVHPGTRLNAADIAFVQQVFAQLPAIEDAAPFTLQYIESIAQGKQLVAANQAGSGSYVIVSVNGWQAYLGDAQNSTSLANRLQELREILSMARQQHLQLATIDLRFGSRVAYTLKP